MEIRLDWLARLSCQRIHELFTNLSRVGLPKIATVMPSTMFGRFSGGESERVALILEAAKQAEYVDVGLEMDSGSVRGCLEAITCEGKAEVILSMHSMRPLPKEGIQKIARHDCGLGCIHKIVMPAESLADNLVALDACLSLKDLRRIIFCYGCNGAASRVLSPLFGSEWTYASLRRGKESAPGQLDIEAVRNAQEAFS